MSVLVEPASYTDLLDVIKIEEIIEGGNAASLDLLDARFAMFADGFFVARQNDQIVGYAQSCLWEEITPSFDADINFFSDRHKENSETLYIIFVGVLPEIQRQGVATELLQSLISLAKLKGCKRVHAVTFDHLIPLYTNQGFIPIKKMPGFLPVGEFTLLEYSLPGN